MLTKELLGIFVMVDGGYWDILNLMWIQHLFIVVQDQFWLFKFFKLGLQRMQTSWHAVLHFFTL